MSSIALSLVSHTNVGKTTLARTLLRRDVGTVFDQAHVTDESEEWTLLEDDGSSLVLWDTPGFGDTARLLRRMREEGSPVGWFLHQVWDRMADRALWCSQEALRNIRDQADVVLYLVSAAEHPEDAGYVKLELDLLGWLETPVVVLLNQTGPPEGVPALERTWKEYTAGWSLVKGVLSLDAFTRCWVQESALLQAVRDAMPVERQATMGPLLSAWDRRNLDVFTAAVDAIVAYLAATATDRERLPGISASRLEKKRAMDGLAERLEQRGRALMETLITAHGLDGESAAAVRERVDDFVVSGDAPIGVRTGAIWGGVVTGAATGVGADLASGGLSFGSGAVVGAVLGALGGAGLAGAYRLVLARGEPGVSWSRDFLGEVVRRSLLCYLAIAQFGRGRGAFHDEVLDERTGSANPWRVAVEEALGSRAGELAVVWKRAARQARLGDGGEAGNGGGETAVDMAMRAIVDGSLRAVLAKRYPKAASLLRVG